MTWILLVLGVGVSVAALAAIAGMLLPEGYRSSARIRLKAPPDVVWNAVADYRKNPASGREARRVEPLPDATLPSWREDLSRTTIIVRTEAVSAPVRLVRSLQDTVVPMTARWEYELTKADGGTLVEIREEGTIKLGTWHAPIFRVMMRLMPGAGVKAHLNALAESLGESAKAE
jgi:hypothetical protein